MIFWACSIISPLIMHALAWKRLACFCCSTPIDILRTAQNTGEPRPNTNDAQQERDKRRPVFWGTNPVTLLSSGDSRKQRAKQALSSVFKRQPPKLNLCRNLKEPKHHSELHGSPINQTLSCPWPHSFLPSAAITTITQLASQRPGICWVPIAYTKWDQWGQTWCCV